MLVSCTGLADIGNEVIGGNRQSLTDVLHLLVPTTDVLARYQDNIRCGIGGIAPFAKSPPLPDPGVLVSVAFTLGIERYRWPKDLPKVNAKSGSTCESQKLPVLPPDFVPPYRVGRHRRQSLAVRKPGHPAELGRPEGMAVRPTRRSAAQHLTDGDARMTGSRNTIIKFGIFAVIMVVLTAFLFATFAQVRTGSTSGYSAVFNDASRLEKGDTVRVAGIRVGTVRDVKLLADRKVQVDFDADKSVVLTTGTKAAIRYLNLVGDRYLELVDAPGSTRILSAGSQIPVDRTSPALDLDLLLGGLKPVLQGLNPQDVNALTSSLVEIFQGQGDTLQSLMTKTSSFSNALADNNQVIEQLIDNLRTVVGTLGDNGKEFSNAVDRFEKVVSELRPGPRSDRHRHHLAGQRDRVAGGSAHPGPAAVGRHGRPAEPVGATARRRARTASTPASRRMPGNYRKLARLGAYGSFIQYYICGITLRVTDLQGRTAEFPWIKQTTGRCAEPDA